MNYKINKISCSNCGVQNNLITLPVTLKGSMFGILFSCPDCFGKLRKASINIHLNEDGNNGNNSKKRQE